MKWARHVASTAEIKNEYKFLLGNLKGRDDCRASNTWEDNIKMDVKEIGMSGCCLDLSGSR
jgi:hypothetical protein